MNNNVALPGQRGVRLACPATPMVRFINVASQREYPEKAEQLTRQNGEEMRRVKRRTGKSIKKYGSDKDSRESSDD